jgi:hypothetical protein
MHAKNLSLTTPLEQPFEIWSNGVYSFAVSTSGAYDYAVEVSLWGRAAGLHTFETLSDCYDWLEARGASYPREQASAAA